METGFRVDNISKRFRKGQEVISALDNVSFSVENESICGLLGNNGAGKTTLIKCVSGLLTPDGGEVFLDGETLLNKPRQRNKRISVVLDGGRNLFWYMTVCENIKYFLMLKGQLYKADDVEMILEGLGLKNLVNKPVQTLSYGMRQRAAIAVAMAAKSYIVFMDEPTNGLDVNYKLELAGLIRKLRDKYKCIFILSSHDMSFIELLCDSCVLIEGGKIVYSGRMNDFNNAFNSVEYSIHYDGELGDLLYCGELNVIEHDIKEKKLSFVWSKDKTINEMVNIFSRGKVDIKRIIPSSGLTTAVSMMSMKRGKTI